MADAGDKAIRAKTLSGVKVLLVEDMASLRMVYTSILAHAGAEVSTAGTCADGRERFRDRPASVVVLDLALPDGDGLALLRDLRGMRSDLRIVVITAHGGVGRAVEAMRAGAHDFLVKPFDEERLVAATRSAAQSLASPGRRPRAIAEGLGAMVGSSRPMTMVARAIAAAAPTMAPVLVTGGPGSGKQLCARMLHALSSRAADPFLPIDCAETEPDEIEAALFGPHGVFAGETDSTLYLADMPAMPLALQHQLLPHLQHGGRDANGRLGSGRVRLVAGISGTADAALAMGWVDDDLIRLLDTLRIDLPPLRERGRDVVKIARVALKHFGAEAGKSFDGLAPQVEDLFCLMPWPGNVRELLNLIRHVVLTNEGGKVTLDMLPERLTRLEGVARTPLPIQGGEPAANAPDNVGPSPATVPATTVVPFAIPREAALRALRGLSLAEIERAVIEDSIAAAGGSLPKAARRLGLAPSTLYRKRQSWGPRGSGAG